MIWALQNDHQNLSFVKDNDLLGDKMIRNGHKNGQPLACHFHFETLFMTSFHLFFLVKEALLIINLIVTFLLTSFFSRSGAGGFSSRKSGFRTDRTDTEHEDNDHRPGNVGKSAYFSSASIPASCTKLLNMFRKITFLFTQLSNSSDSFTQFCNYESTIFLTKNTVHMNK